MKYKVCFKHFTVRQTPISAHYRPDWLCDSKPEYNCAQLLFDEPKLLYPGKEAECILEPFQKSLWNEVKVGDILKCMEGPKQVGEALVLKIIK